MKSRYFSSIPAALLLFFLASAVIPAEPSLDSGYQELRSRAAAARQKLAEPEEESVSIVVYHTNDIHGSIDAQPPNPEKHFSGSGGVASLATLLSRESRPHYWVDSGDWFQGTPEGNLSRGEAVIDVFNRLGLTAAVLGNHDYDYGEGNVLKLARKASFPILGSNILSASNGKPAGYVTPYVIREPAPGVKIGFFGLLSSGMPGLAFPRHIEGLSFGREADAARKAVAELRDQGADIVVAVTHVGIEENRARHADIKEGDLFLAKNVPGIDAIMGGHTHQELRKPMIVDNGGRKVLITQNGSRLRTVYQVVFEVGRKSGRLLRSSGKLIHLDPAKIPPDPETHKIVEKYKASIEREMGRVIGASSVAMELRADRECLMANWIADVMRRHAKADLAAINTFGIRAELPRGELTYGHLYRVMPFDNSLAKVRLLGSELRKLAEKNMGPNALTLQFSGAEIVYDPAQPEGRRVLAFNVGGAPLQEERVYTLAALDFVATVDPVFDGIRREVETTPELLRDILVEEVRRRGVISASLDGRLRRAVAAVR